MEEIILLLAAMTPEKELIERIKALSTEYCLVPSEEKRNKLITVCLLVTLKQTTDGTIDGAIKSMKELQSIKERNVLFDKSPN